MPLLTTLASLSQTPASNAADGSVDAPSTMDNQVNLLASFIAQLRDGKGFTVSMGSRNLLVNANFAINQRVYVSGTATTGASQVTLDRWRVVTSGQSFTFGAGSPDVVVTCPAGGLEQVIEPGWVAGGIYTLSWTGSATATVNGTVIANGAQTASLTANTAVSVKFSGGTVDKPQFELGSVANIFDRRPVGTEMQLCQREFIKSYALGTVPGNITPNGRFFGGTNQSGFITWAINLSAPMRITPAVSIWDQNSNANSVLSFTAAGVATTRSAVTQNTTDHSFEVLCSSAGTDVVMAGHWAAATGF